MEKDFVLFRRSSKNDSTVRLHFLFSMHTHTCARARVRSFTRTNIFCNVCALFSSIIQFLFIKTILIYFENIYSRFIVIYLLERIYVTHLEHVDYFRIYRSPCNAYINDLNDLTILTIQTRLRSQRNVYLPATHTRMLLYFKCRQVNARPRKMSKDCKSIDTQIAIYAFLLTLSRDTTF